MLEVDCSILTPEPVLRASGHLQRFTDLMVRDLQTGECFRADRLLSDHAQRLLAEIQIHKNAGSADGNQSDKKKKDASSAKKPNTLLFDMHLCEEQEEEKIRALVEGAGTLSPEDLRAELCRLKVRSPVTGNELSEVCLFVRMVFFFLTVCV